MPSRNSLSGLLLCFFAIAPWACGDDDDSETYTLGFVARVGADPVQCGVSYPGMGSAGESIQIRDFRMYLSDIRLVAPDGTEEPLSLEQDGTWQVQDVALLDFEDGTETCSETGNALLNQTIRGTSSIEDVSGLRFRLGVPFELNHFDHSTQPAPLNVTSMFWNWQGGYKFVRVDFETARPAPGNVFNIHLGSTGCESPSPVQGPDAPCSRPNLPDVALDGFDPSVNTVVFDLAALLQGVDTSTDTPDTPPGCMSAPTEPADCTEIFQNLGMSFDTGSCAADCAGQRFVRVE